MAKPSHGNDPLRSALVEAQEFHRLRMGRRRLTYSLDEPHTWGYILFRNAKFHREFRLESGRHFVMPPA